MNRLLIGGGDQLPLLRHLIQKDMHTGVTVIDPDGRLAHAIGDCIPEELNDHVLYFDPSDQKHVASFSVFDDVHKADRPKLVQDLCAFFDALFPAGAETLTRQYGNYVLANALTILLDSPSLSFLSVLEFLNDASFRQAVLKECSNPVAARNWAAIELWDTAQRKQAFANVETKVGTLLLSPVLYRTLEAKEPTFYLGKTPILIADLSRKKLGDSAARLLGTLLISRAETPVYIHDFGFFASDYLASLFSYGGYTITLKALSDISKSQEQTVLGFKDKRVFHVTPDDAKKLQPYISGVTNPAVLTDLSGDEFLPRLDLDAPLARKRLKAIRKRSDACHARPATAAAARQPKRRRNTWP